MIIKEQIQHNYIDDNEIKDVRPESIDSVIYPIGNFPDAYRLEPLKSDCRIEKESSKYIEFPDKESEINELLNRHDYDDSKLEEGIKHVFGRDDRVRITGSKLQTAPYSSVGRITFRFPDGRGGIGSGFYIGNDKVLTAGHVVWDTKVDKPHLDVWFEPQRDGSSLPLGRYKAEKILVSKRYIDFNRYHFVFDWAIIKVSGLMGKLCPLPVYGSKQLVHSMFGTLGPQPLEVTGYPGKVRNVTIGDQMYTHRAKGWVGRNDFISGYNIDYSAGQSGGPVITMSNNGQNKRVIGVVSGEISNRNGAVNKMSTIMHDDILEIWKFGLSTT
jgi:V8-like Glu-specific endopeptidase